MAGRTPSWTKLFSSSPKIGTTSFFSSALFFGARSPPRALLSTGKCFFPPPKAFSQKISGRMEFSFYAPHIFFLSAAVSSIEGRRSFRAPFFFFFRSFRSSLEDTIPYLPAASPWLKDGVPLDSFLRQDPFSGVLPQFRQALQVAPRRHVLPPDPSRMASPRVNFLPRQGDGVREVGPISPCPGLLVSGGPSPPLKKDRLLRVFSQRSRALPNRCDLSLCGDEGPSCEIRCVPFRLEFKFFLLERDVSFT